MAFDPDLSEEVKKAFQALDADIRREVVNHETNALKAGVTHNSAIDMQVNSYLGVDLGALPVTEGYSYAAAKARLNEELAQRQAGNRAKKTYSPKEKLYMRMNWDSGAAESHPFHRVEVFAKPSGDFLVFIIVDETHVVIPDSKDLFPSDSLISSIRMLVP